MANESNMTAFNDGGNPYRDLLETFLKVPVYQYYFDGLLDAAYAQISAGNVGYQIIPAVLIYIGGALLLATVVFRKKEIEF